MIPRDRGDMPILPRLLVLLLLCWRAPSVAASGVNPPVIEEVVVGFPGILAGRDLVPAAPFKVATWTPVRVHLAALSTPGRGQVAISAPDSDGTPTSTFIPVDLEAGSDKTVIGYTRFGALECELQVKLIDETGKTIGKPHSQPFSRPLGWSTLLVLGAGNTSGLREVPGLTKFLDAGDGRPGLAIAPWSSLPDQTLGLDSVEALALASDDRDVIERLAGNEGRVLRDWVAHGGHLVVSLSPANWQRVGEVLGDLLPAHPAGPQVLSDLAPVEGFADKVSKQIKQPMTVVRLELTDPRTITLAATAATPLVVRRSYGLGRVTLTGVDVAEEPFSSWKDRPSYWEKLLDIRGRASDADAAISTSRGALIQSANPDLAAQMLKSLETFPGIHLIPFGWVAGLIFGYLLLIGPIDYWVLKRVLKRMEWTWLTFPLIVLGATGLAFGLARAMKGSELRVNKVDLLDVEQAHGVYRGSTWMTVFSPGNHDFALEMDGVDPSFRPQAEPTSVEPELGLPSLSWFSPPESGMSGIGKLALGNRQASYPPRGGLDKLSGERIPIWSTKSFSGRWSGTVDPLSLVESTLRAEAGDRAGGSIRNRTGKTLRRAQLFYGKNVYELGTIRPDGVARVTSTKSEAIPRALGRFIQEALQSRKNALVAARQASARGVETSPPAAALLRAAIFHDSMGNRADIYPNSPLRRLDMTAQVGDLRRPVLVAEIDDEVCHVGLEGAPGAARTQQVTILRILLDMESSIAPITVPVTRPAAEDLSGTTP